MGFYRYFIRVCHLWTRRNQCVLLCFIFAIVYYKLYGNLSLKQISSTRSGFLNSWHWGPQEEKPTQSSFGMKLSKDIKIHYHVLDNSEDLKSGLIVIFNSGETDISLSNAKLYFCNIRNLNPVSNEHLRIIHINGCLYKIEAVQRPLILKPRKNIRIYITLKGYTSARTDIMPNWFFVTEDKEVCVVENTTGEDLSFVSNFEKREQWICPIFDNFKPLTPNDRYDSVGVDPVELNDTAVFVIPQPLSISTTDKTKTLVINNRWKFYADKELKREADFVKDFFQISSRSFSKHKEANLIVLTIGDPGVKLSNKELEKESYLLQVNSDDHFIEIIGKTAAGVFYGVQTLISLASEKGAVPKVTIKDAPRFAFRGMHVDVARNFKPKSSIIRLLNGMSMYKMNKLHLHLSDDEAWRLEIPGIEELTEIGSRRCYDPSENKCIHVCMGSDPTMDRPQYYSVADYQEILQYANDRHIQVIPELDMPAHSYAAIKSMQARYRFYSSKEDSKKAEEFFLSELSDNSQYASIQQYFGNTMNPCLESTFKFIKHVFNAVKEIHKHFQPLTTYHFGGDEVPKGAWENSPSCINLASFSEVDLSTRVKEHFLQRISGIASSLGLSLGGWADIFPTNKLISANVTTWSWDDLPGAGKREKAYFLARKGYKVVFAHASHLYFDHPQEPDPEERGFFWAARYSDTRKVFGYVPNFCRTVGQCGDPTIDEKIHGITGCMWSETIRTVDQMEFMIFPRILALAERAWHKASWEDTNNEDKFSSIDKDWKIFATFVAKHELPRLEKLGIKYRIPPPGIRIENKKIKVRTALPGLPVLYSQDGGKTWNDVTDDTRLEGDVIFATSSLDRQRKSRQVTVNI